MARGIVNIAKPKVKPSVAKIGNIVEINDIKPIAEAAYSAIARTAADVFTMNMLSEIKERRKYASGDFYNSVGYRIFEEGNGTSIELDTSKLVSYFKQVDRGRKPTDVPVSELVKWIKDKRSAGKLDNKRILTNKTLRGSRAAQRMFLGSTMSGKRGYGDDLRKDTMAFYRFNKFGGTHKISDIEAAQVIRAAIKEGGTKSSRFRLLGIKKAKNIPGYSTGMTPVQTPLNPYSMEPEYLMYDRFLSTEIQDKNYDWLKSELSEANIKISKGVDEFRLMQSQEFIKSLWDKSKIVFEDATRDYLALIKLRFEGLVKRINHLAKGQMQYIGGTSGDEPMETFADIKGVNVNTVYLPAHIMQAKEGLYVDGKWVKIKPKITELGKKVFEIPQNVKIKYDEKGQPSHWYRPKHRRSGKKVKINNKEYEKEIEMAMDASIKMTVDEAMYLYFIGQLDESIGKNSFKLPKYRSNKRINDVIDKLQKEFGKEYPFVLSISDFNDLMRPGVKAAMKESGKLIADWKGKKIDEKHLLAIAKRNPEMVEENVKITIQQWEKQIDEMKKDLSKMIEKRIVAVPQKQISEYYRKIDEIFKRGKERFVFSGKLGYTQIFGEMQKIAKKVENEWGILLNKINITSDETRELKRLNKLEFNVHFDKMGWMENLLDTTVITVRLVSQLTGIKIVELVKDIWIKELKTTLQYSRQQERIKNMEDAIARNTSESIARWVYKAGSINMAIYAGIISNETMNILLKSANTIYFRWKGQLKDTTFLRNLGKKIWSKYV